MNNYYLDELNDPEREVVRPIGTKKHAQFHHCKWAAGDWEAKFYAWTPSHRKACERTIKSMTTCSTWFKKKLNQDKSKQKKRIDNN